jgi:hypothetical protein
MTTTYFIAGSVFLILSGIGALWAWNQQRNADNEKAKKDIDSAIDSRDWDALDDARRRLR